MAPELTDEQLDSLAERVAERLPSGRYGDRVILTRRQAIALSGSGLSLAALGFGSGSAAAADGTNDTSVGDVGASGNSVDVYLDQLLDPGGDEVVNVDDTGYIDATPREWRFGDLNATNFSFSGDLGMGGNDITGVGSLTADSLSTDSVKNSSIGDSVNYINPQWLAVTDAIWFSAQFLSIDGFEQSTSGSASLSLDTARGVLDLNTGSTSGSVARATYHGGSRMNPNSNFNKDSVLRLGFEILNNDNGRKDYYTRGRPKNGDKGFGFKLVDGGSNNGKIQGVVHNGTSETTTDLVSDPGRGAINARAEFTAGTDVEFIINGTNEGTISSGLPSGTGGPLLELAVENTNAANRRTRFGNARMVQSP